MTDEEIRAIRKIYMVGCGSAYHTAMTAKYVMEGLARIPVEVDLASEFRYRNPILDRDTWWLRSASPGRRRIPWRPSGKPENRG